MSGAKLFKLFFMVIIAEAQFHSLQHTKNPWEASKLMSDISSHLQITSNLTQSTIAPDVIIVYPETHENKTSVNVNFTLPPYSLIFKPIVTSHKDYIPSLTFPKGDQEEEFDKSLKDKPSVQLERIEGNSNKAQPDSISNPISNPISELDPKLNLKIEPESGQESNPVIETNAVPKTDNKSDKELKLELELQPVVKLNPESTTKIESQSELQSKPQRGAENKPKMETAGEPEKLRKPKTNPQLTPEQTPEIHLQLPNTKPSENLNETELNSKEQPKFRPRPPFPGYSTTSVSPPSILDHERLNPGTPEANNLKSSTQSSIPIRSTQATVVPPTAHNLSKTTLRPDVEILCKEENAFYAIPYECDTFVECKQYVAEKYICADGLLFNSKALWPEFPCAYPSEVECANKTIIQEPEPVGECPRRFGSFPSQSGDCGKYVVCDDGRAANMSCPSGLAFNSISSACDWPENVPNCKPKVFQDFTCPAPPKDFYDRQSEKVYNFKYQDSCKEYIACSKGEPRLLRCDIGLSFDEISKRCIDSKLVKNCEGYSST